MHKQRLKCIGAPTRPVSLALIAFALLATSSSLQAAPSIFDDDWKPATLPANRTEAKPEQTATQPKPAQIVARSIRVNPPSQLEPKAARLHVPEKAELAATRKVFRELFQKDLNDASQPARHSLAVKLLAEGARCQDKPLDQYVLFAAAYQAALDAQDFSLCFDTVHAMSAAFEVDGLALKAQAMIASGLKGATPAAGFDNCRAAISVLMGLIDAEDFATAAKLARLLQTAAAGDPFLKPAIAKRIKSLEVNRAAHDKYARDRERLRAAPDDAAAKENLAILFCFCKKDWERGLPLFAEGMQPEIQKLATAELSGPTKLEAIQQIAAGWAIAAGKQPEGYRDTIREHALDLYRKALADSTGLQTREIELAIQKLSAAIGPQWVDLLDLADPDKDSAHGKWSRDSLTLTGQGNHDRLELPYIPAAEYAFRIDFTPTRSIDAVFMGIVKDDKPFQWVMGNAGNQFANFQTIDGKGLDGNKSVRNFNLVAGHRYSALIEVYNNRLTASIDGKLIVEWPTDYHEFSTSSTGDWRPKNPSKLAVGDWTTTTVFHRIEVMELSGTGTVSR